MRFFVPAGAVFGFAYEFGMTWYVTWSPQAQAHVRPMVGPDVIIMSGFLGAFWGALLGAAAEAMSRTFSNRRRANAERVARQAAEASIAAPGVWPPPPQR